MFETFAILGVIYVVMVVGASFFIKNPPEGYKPEGWEPDTSEKAATAPAAIRVRRGAAHWQWYALWALLFLNVTAGIAIIAEAAPMTEEIGGATATAAASSSR